MLKRNKNTYSNYFYLSKKNDLYEAGLRWGCHFGFVAHVHDEIQAIVKPQFTTIYKDLAINCFRKAGEFYELKCPLTGEAKEGKNWMETH